MSDPTTLDPQEDARRRKQALMVAYGDSGLRMYGGYLTEEFIRELSGERAMRVFREMSENDATIGAILEAITALITGAEWSVTAADETEEAEDAKKRVEDIFLADMETPLEEVMTEVCTMFPYGFAPMEIIYAPRDDGMIGVRSMELRSQTSLSRWEVDREGKLLGMWQAATWKNTVLIPIERIALFRTKSVKSNPQGRSILRSIYRAWHMKCKMEEIEAIGVERDLAGLPVLSIPNQYFDPNASPEDKAFFAYCKRLVTQLRRESREGIVMPSDVFEHNGQVTGIRQVELKLLSSGGGRTFDTNGIIARYDRAIATSVLADFVFLGQQSVGSFALSSDKTALFAQVVGSYLRRIAIVLNSVVKRVWEINGLNPSLMPKLTPGDIETRDPAEMANFLATLSGSGAQVFPDRDLENFLRRKFGLPLLSEDEGGADPGDQGAPGEGDEWTLAERMAPPSDQMEKAGDVKARIRRALAA